MSILDKIKKKLRPIKNFFTRDYKITYSQVGEDLIVLSALNGLDIKKPTYLDVGAHHPTYLSNTYLFYKNGNYGVCVEPDPYLFKKFKEKRRKDVCLNVGVGFTDENEADFYIMSARTLNTFSKDEAYHMQETTRYKIENIIKVPLVNINKIIKDNFKNKPNFVSLDVEGLDLEILKNFDFDKYRPEVFCLETKEFVEDRENPKDNKIIDFMLGKGYFVFADTYINTIFVDKKSWISSKNKDLIK